MFIQSKDDYNFAVKNKLLNPRILSYFIVQLLRGDKESVYNIPLEFQDEIDLLCRLSDIGKDN